MPTELPSHFIGAVSLLVLPLASGACQPAQPNGDYRETESMGSSSRGDESSTMVSSFSSTAPDDTTVHTSGSGSDSGSSFGDTEPACGNGLVEGEEECDDVEGSATCDQDCTFADCGDRAVNAAAGEECDEGGATARCDGDCTVVVCGDGLINEAVGEECDGASLGEETCASLGFGDGTLNCTESCSYDTSACLACGSACSDVVMWLRADAGVMTNASGVTVWEDQSGSSNDATQASASNEPELLNAAINGYPTLNFLGDDWLGFDSMLSLQDMTIFLVARNNGPGVGLILGPAAVDNSQIRYENPTQILSVGTGNNLSAITSTIGNNQVYHSITIRYDGVTWEVWRDGVLASSTPEGVTGPLTLGRLGSWFGGQFGLVGEIAEVMVYDVALAMPQRIEAESYLRTKYALP